MLPFFVAPFAHSSFDDQQVRDFGRHMAACVGVRQDAEQARGKHVMSMIEYVRVQPKKPHFLLELEFALNTERRQWHSEKHEQPLLFMLLHVSQQLTPKMMMYVTEGKRDNP